MRAVLLSLLIGLLSACATTPPVTTSANMCAFKIKERVISDPRRMHSDAAAVSPSGEDSAVRKASASIPGPSLVLSGGSQHGAFGAGFLKRWAELSPDNRLPVFDQVTGISTGAILATWAFIGEPETVAAEYNIENERQLLNVYGSPAKGGTIGLGAALILIRKNGLADLGPLRARLRKVIDYRTLKAVTEQRGRLVIGAVEVDTGNAVLFDMKDMARRAIKAQPQGKFDFYRDCYAEAIMASSSVPLGAMPVFIDNRMYIDGGARFGVFVESLSKVKFDNDDDGETTDTAQDGTSSPQPGRIGAALPKAPPLYIIVNGTQWVPANCGKIDTKLCKDDDLRPDRASNTAGAHKKWDIASLAFRSNDILANQVYRFSVSYVQYQYLQAYPLKNFSPSFYFARIHRTDLNNATEFSFNGKSCRQWHEIDKAKLKPFQFYPNYMKCLQAYGANQIEELKWYQPNAPSNFQTQSAL